MTTIKLNKPLRTVKLNGLGEVPVLHYSVAKEHGVKEGDTVAIEQQITPSTTDASVFEVGSYVKLDMFGNKVSGFVLQEK